MVGEDTTAGAPELMAEGTSPPPVTGCAGDVGAGLIDGKATTSAVGR